MPWLLQRPPQQSESLPHACPSGSHPHVPWLLQNWLQHSKPELQASPSSKQHKPAGQVPLQQSTSNAHSCPIAWHPHFPSKLQKPPQQSEKVVQPCPSAWHPHVPWLLQKPPQHWSSDKHDLPSGPQDWHWPMRQLLPAQQSLVWRQAPPAGVQGGGPPPGGGEPAEAATGTVMLSIAGGTQRAPVAMAPPARTCRRVRRCPEGAGPPPASPRLPLEPSGCGEADPRIHRKSTRRVDGRRPPLPAPANARASASMRCSSTPAPSCCDAQNEGASRRVAARGRSVHPSSA